ncbi:STAS domain-containing protein [Nonomuraea sp. NPDC050783]|uniref:STAS domain-containing protein n=1 Tax=Nonomuraea sp. NPDC050783 TaxID=3154634 RepID=UPI003466B0D1
MAAQRGVPDYRRSWTAIVLHERIDAVTATDLEREAQLLAGEAPRLILEVSRLDVLDDFGYDVLVRLAGGLRERGGRMAVAGARAHVRRVLTQPGSHGLLPLFPTVAEAVLSLDDDPTAGGSPPSGD